MREPLPITGWSAVNALGRTTAEVLAALDAGRSGLGPCPFPLPFDTQVGVVPGDLPPPPAELAAYDCRLARLGLLAFDDVRAQVARAVSRWGSERVAILVGTSTGGLDATEDAYASFAKGAGIPDKYSVRQQHDFAALGELLAKVAGVTGPTWVISTACSSSGKVHATASRLIRAGIIDAALVGGIDSLCHMTLHGFRGLGILSSAPCRPFGAGREGINIGEGAALMLIERASEATRAEAQIALVGVGESADAYNMSSPEPSGRGAREAMERALGEAGLSASDVDHLNAHATATQQNDQAESLAIEALFGDRVPVVSTKGYTGHLLGAAGATEAVFAAHALLCGRVPRSLGSDPIDPELGKIHVATEGLSANLRHVISNSFAFGGSNVCVALAKMQDAS